jgi:hypothetical protein
LEEIEMWTRDNVKMWLTLELEKAKQMEAGPSLLLRQEIYRQLLKDLKDDDWGSGHDMRWDASLAALAADYIKEWEVVRQQLIALGP